ncbi:MAG TPA: cold-shock protein [Candidatus Acidoferrum sp.]|nr:cold-shock protein [Candidatus Acidoferrum sp.]
MNVKTLLAVLGPALVLALLTQPLALTELLPAPVLVLVVALVASISTLVLRALKPPKRQAVGKPVTRSGAKETGNVKWFNASKGFGFITRANGEEIFVHFRSIVGQRSLRDGQRVEFAVTNGSKGLQAEDVVALK